MRTIRRRSLAVCMAALLMMSGFSTTAAETLQAENGIAAENVAAVSGGNADPGEETPGETEEAGEGDLTDIVVEDQILLLAGNDIASGTDGNITWVIDAGGKLTVSGTGDLSGKHSASDFAWAPYCEQIISAELNVTGMTDASRLFSDCRNMTGIDLSGFDTSSVTNMEAMFSNCSSLTSLDVSHFDTSHVTDMGAMFFGCSSLTSLDVSHFDTSNVSSMVGSVVLFRQENTVYYEYQGIFSGCSSLTDLDVSGFNTSNVTDMEKMFSDCSSLTDLDVSGFNTGSVTNMAYMFSGCSGLTSVAVSGFDTGSVTDMRGMFSGCGNLANLDVSGFDTSSVTNMAYMFSGCSGLTSVAVSGFDTSSVTNMAYMFSGCSSLTSVAVSGFDTGSVTNLRGMFSESSNLVNLDVSGFDTGNVTDMGGMFNRCSNLADVNVSGFNTSAVTDMESMFAGCSSLSVVDVSGFYTGNVTDMNYMFAGCSGLTNLAVSGFDTGNVTDMEAMFLDCSGLSNLNIDNFVTGNVTDMAYMFSECNGLTNLEVGNFNTSNVTSMTGMFAGCDNLVDLDIKNFDTSNVTSMGGMFSHCSSLKRLDLSNFNTGKAEKMSGFIVTGLIEGGHTGRWSGMFTGCGSLEYLDVSSFDTSNVTDMFWMFDGCSSLTSLDLSSFDVGNVTDLEDMFLKCRNLTTLASPRNINCPVLTPAVRGTVWHLPDGTEVTELPRGLEYSVTLTRSGVPSAPQITTTTPDLNMEDVVRVKYVPYSYTVETDADEEDTVEFFIEEGRLADGLQLYSATGEIYGVPLETGTFPITVKAVYGNPAYPPAYVELTLTVLDNTDGNVGVATDPGYDITQPVTDFNMDAMAGEGTQTLVSLGEYAQFQHAVYIDGRKLTEGQEYTSESGSTRITILNQTLAGDGAGTHTIGVEFRTEDGTLKRAAQNYTISSGAETPPGDGKDDPENPSGDEGDTPNPPGDGSRPPVTSPAENESNTIGGSDMSVILPGAASWQDFIIYTVEKGDSLWKIAVRFYGQGSGWRRIYEDNAAVIKNPGRLYTGQKLVIRMSGLASPVPDTPISAPASDESAWTEISYRVQKGDRLWTIARRVYGDGRLWRIIYEANRDIIADPERIREGQVISIPQR